MFNVCPKCGAYSEEKAIDPAGPTAICPRCGHPHPFRQLPLFVITGASGSGKSALCLELSTTMQECVFIDQDILWRAEFARPADNYRTFRNLCLRVAKNIGQAGRPVVLCGSAIPEQYEGCSERRYFAEIHYLALVCGHEILADRLRRRPAWRKSAEPGFIEEMGAFDRWLREQAGSTQPPMTVLDNSQLSVGQTAARAADWIRLRLP
jgi:hypothetical protein